MVSVGSFGESLWGSAPGLDDAETVLGAFVQSPLTVAITLLCIAAALMLFRAGATIVASDEVLAPHNAAGATASPDLRAAVPSPLRPVTSAATTAMLPTRVFLDATSIRSTFAYYV